MRIRKFEESNYKAIHIDGKTLRIALDPSKPITELKYPEFYDVSITGKCHQKNVCEYCYMSSRLDGQHYPNIINKFIDHFGKMNENEKPFQIAYGGAGEPTFHPEFLDLLKITYEYGITGNYTTNGYFITDEDLTKKLLEYTKKYCGGVALSCHPHLKNYWEKAADIFLNEGIMLNFHLIISDKDSIDKFSEIYEKYKGKISYFVLLPYIAQGRAEQKEIDWEYLKTKLNKDMKDIAFGAHFHPYLMQDDLDMDVSLYEPEIMSKFISFEGNGSIYKSSFSLENPIKTNIFEND